MLGCLMQLELRGTDRLFLVVSIRYNLRSENGKDDPMPLGVDPKNDYAFKRMLTQEQYPEILIHLLNAVLQPPAGNRVITTDILNPIVPQEALDEKTLILDIRARDQSGRLFNVEMQMALHPFLSDRFLLYWARMYGSQLTTGEDYEQLNPSYVICFLNGVLFPQTDAWHLHFQPWDRRNQVLFSDHQHIHFFQLPNFQKKADELEGDLEQWLYFLNNGMLLEPGQLPSPLQNNPIEKAIEVLTMFTQDEIERERIESRERAARDARAWANYINDLKRQGEELEAKRRQLEAQRDQFESQREQLEREQRQAKETAERAQIELIAKQIQIHQRLLKETPTAFDTLQTLPLDELLQLAETLETRLLDQADGE